MLKNIFSRTTERELGFGSTATTQGRMMNRDGAINARRSGGRRSDNVYHHLVTMSWGLFSGLIFLFFGVLNVGFALLYVAIGVEHIGGIEPGGPVHNFVESFFFSTQTLTTVGYGRVNPTGWTTNLVASFESLFGLLSFALISGLLYGRFSRPTARILFSENMLRSPFKDGHALMFRMANGRKSELIETEVTVILALNQDDSTGKNQVVRRFHSLDLEIAKIPFFTLSWTIVHALTEKSPLFGFSEKDLETANAEFLILVKGVDDTYAQAVHARHSYTSEELLWDAKFSPIIAKDRRGRPEVLLKKLSEFESTN